jgi:hypothetical protein
MNKRKQQKKKAREKRVLKEKNLKRNKKTEACMLCANGIDHEHGQQNDFFDNL